MTYTIYLNDFEGPLDLLIFLIEKNKLDIYDIPIALVTEQYLAYLHEREDFDLDIASEFIVMAATLLQIKSRLLLPKSKPNRDENMEEEADPRQALVDRLLEYKYYKQIANLFQELFLQTSVFYTREPMEFPMEISPPAVISFQELSQAFLQLNSEEEPLVAVVAAEGFTVRNKMKDILSLLQQQEGAMNFTYALIRTAGCKGEIITTFLAVLELVRLQRIRFIQKQAFSSIYLETKERIKACPISS